MKKLLQIALCLLLLICGALTVPYVPLWEIGIVASNEFLGGSFSGDHSAKDVRTRSKDLSVKDLKEMLTHANPDASAFAAKALALREEASALPELIQGLNNTRPFRERATREETSTAAVSKAAIITILKAQIRKQPENIALLTPLFTAAERGTAPERKAAIEILGELKEPLAKPLLEESVAERDRDLSGAARQALAQIDAQGTESEQSAALANWQMRLILVAGLLGAALLVASVFRLIRGEQRRLALLSIAPIFLLGSFGAVIFIDHSRGIVSAEHLDAALRGKNLWELRTILYHEASPYPGDSYVARQLLTRFNEDMFGSFLSLPSVQSTDYDVFTKLADSRQEWILSRFLVANLDSPKLRALLSSKDKDVRRVTASTLGKLGIKNEQIIGALTLLAGDSNERVKKTAEEALAKVNRNPVWTPTYGPKIPGSNLSGAGRQPRQ
jgi:HEAT repeat protein